MRAVRTIAALALTGAAAACELTESTAASGDDLVVVEALVKLGGPDFWNQPDVVGGATASINDVRVMLHRTIEGDLGRNQPVPGARVELRLPDGAVLRLPEVNVDYCRQSAPVEGTGSCYFASSIDADERLAAPLRSLRGGMRLDLSIETVGGERLSSTSRIPGDFELLGVASGSTLDLAANTLLDLGWTVSEGAWSYVAEAEISGLPAALAAEGITVEDDPLFLLGLAISASDTTIVFPSEFGVFDRFDLDRDLSLRLQQGLPAATRSRISVAAVDRNYVNWIRGGNFNPSGQVRVPSVQGDGTGFFGTSVVRWFDLSTGGL